MWVSTFPCGAYDDCMQLCLSSAGAALAAGVALDEAKQEQPLTTAAPKIAQPQGNSRKPAAKCDEQRSAARAQ